ncbi:hypothetical protein GQ457_17G006650 [Hibiscus cannabinus]
MSCKNRTEKLKNVKKGLVGKKSTSMAVNIQVNGSGQRLGQRVNELMVESTCQWIGLTHGSQLNWFNLRSKILEARLELQNDDEFNGVGGDDHARRMRVHPGFVEKEWMKNRFINEWNEDKRKCVHIASLGKARRQGGSRHNLLFKYDFVVMVVCISNGKGMPCFGAC